MKTKNQNFLIGTLLAVVLGFSSCKKEEPVTTPKQSYEAKIETLRNVSQKNAVATATIFNLSNSLPQLLLKTAKYMKKEDGIPMGNGSTCATVSIDSTVSPRVATFDFGGGCTDSDGIVYSGIITLQYTDPDMGVAGNHVHVVFNHFTRDTISFNGSFDFYNDGTNGAGNMIGRVSINMASNFVHDNLRVNGTTDATFELVIARSVTQFNITGTVTDGNGLTFTESTNSTINQSHVDGCGNHFTKGVLLIQSAGLPDEEIDYGNGTCDDQATSTILGVSTPFTLP